MKHTPVLLEEVIQFFSSFAGGKFIDATVGYGGHTFAMLERIPGSRVLGIDADASALAFLSEERKRRGVSEERLKLVQGNFRAMDELARNNNWIDVQGILFDLGVSSGELADPVRGFSFLHEGPLDMRLDQTSGQTALDLVNQWPSHALERIIRDYGEERRARDIAEAIVRVRQRAPIVTTTALAECIARLPGMRRGKLHPATRTFQALRIAVNDELNALRDVLPKALHLLDSGGRLATIAFHSLEDRIVKEFVKEEGRVKKSVRILTKHVVKPTREEVLANVRSRSARLRVVEKIK